MGSQGKKVGPEAGALFLTSEQKKAHFMELYGAGPETLKKADPMEVWGTYTATLPKITGMDFGKIEQTVLAEMAMQTGKTTLKMLKAKFNDSATQGDGPYCTLPSKGQE